MTVFLTSQEMQELINVDRSTVYRMAEDGRLPGVKVGRQWRFPADRVREQLGVDVAARSTTADRSQTTSPGAAASGEVLLDELLAPEVAQSIADLVGDLFGVMSVITDMHGRPLTAVANPCGYYAAIANQPAAAEACLSEWRLFAEEPHVAPRFVRTHLGFLCARTFIWIELKPVGMIVVGGVTPPTGPPAPEALAVIADEIGVAVATLTEAAPHTWHLDAGEQRRILQLLPQFGDLVSHLATARSSLLAAAHRSPNGSTPTIKEGTNP